jgi:hypothetical protein
MQAGAAPLELYALTAGADPGGYAATHFDCYYGLDFPHEPGAIGGSETVQLLLLLMAEHRAALASEEALLDALDLLCRLDLWRDLVRAALPVLTFAAARAERRLCAGDPGGAGAFRLLAERAARPHELLPAALS